MNIVWNRTNIVMTDRRPHWRANTSQNIWNCNVTSNKEENLKNFAKSNSWILVINMIYGSNIYFTGHFFFQNLIHSIFHVDYEPAKLLCRSHLVPRSYGRLEMARSTDNDTAVTADHSPRCRIVLFFFLPCPNPWRFIVFEYPWNS